MHQREVLLLSTAEMWVSDTHIGQGVGTPKGKLHQLTPAKSFARVAPPVVAEMKKKFICQDPGDVAGPVFPEAMPVDDICPGQKTTIEEIMDHQRRSIPNPSLYGPSPFSVSPWGPCPANPSLCCGSTDVAGIINVMWWSPKSQPHYGVTTVHPWRHANVRYWFCDAIFLKLIFTNYYKIIAGFRVEIALCFSYHRA